MLLLLLETLDRCEIQDMRFLVTFCVLDSSPVERVDRGVLLPAVLTQGHGGHQTGVERLGLQSSQVRQARKSPGIETRSTAWWLES